MWLTLGKGIESDNISLGVFGRVTFRREDDRDSSFLLHLELDAIESSFDTGL
jgi:hypothetical protein